MRTHEIDARRKDPNEIRILVVGDSVINGGAQTDQAQLMTTRMEEQLKTYFKRPAVVMNVSAGSWSPPNYWAYVKRFGYFEADAMVIVVSSHNHAYCYAFEPMVGVEPEFPDRTPTTALGEAITRYLRRYVEHLAAPRGGVAAAPSSAEPSQGQIDQAMGAFRALVAGAQARKIPVIVGQHYAQSEIGKPETEGHRDFRLACEDLHVDRVEWNDEFQAAMKAGRSPYRDDIHTTALGQEIMLKVLQPEVSKVLAR
jgi:hypothetical protein